MLVAKVDKWWWEVDKVTNLAAGSAGVPAAVLRAPQRCFVLFIDDGQSFPNAVAAGTANVSLPLAGSV